MSDFLAILFYIVRSYKIKLYSLGWSVFFDNLNISFEFHFMFNSPSELLFLWWLLAFPLQLQHRNCLSTLDPKELLCEEVQCRRSKISLWLLRWWWRIPESLGLFVERPEVSSWQPKHLKLNNLINFTKAMGCRAEK